MKWAYLKMPELSLRLMPKGRRTKSFLIALPGRLINIQWLSMAKISMACYQKGALKG
jgi:hypothetical protein